MSYAFSSRSWKQLQTCHPDLIRVFESVIQKTPVDFCIEQGARTVKQARANFHSGKSQLDPDQGQFSKHIVGPQTGREKSWALDLFPIQQGRRKWSDGACRQIAQCVREVSTALEIRIRWGGAWKGWDFPNQPRQFMDLGHFELRDPQAR